MQRYAKDQIELARLLGVTRQTVGNCLRHYKTARPPVPQTKADGRYDVEAWREFLLAHNIARKAESVPADELPDVETDEGNTRTVADWKAEKVRLDCERIEINNRKLKGELVEVAELEPMLGAMLSAFRTAANNLPGRASQKLIGLRDYHDVEEILKAEVAVTLRTLEACPFLPDQPVVGNPVTAVVAKSATTEPDITITGVHVSRTAKTKGMPHRHKPNKKNK